MRAKIIKSLKTIFYKIVPSRLFNNSYSQAGEDKIIHFLFQSLQIKPTYLELGTNYPDIGNNTLFFYDIGCRGTLVEADPSLISIIKKRRIKDTILNIGVSTDEQKEADFYIFNASSLNTFSKEEAIQREKFGTQKIKKIIRVPLKTINEIITSNFNSFPDFLSIDIEGLDLDVLKTLDFDKFPIPVICAETCVYSETYIKPKDNKIEEFLSSKGYFVYADSYINTIFVNNKWFYNR